MTDSTPLLITLGIYLLAMVGIGFVAWKRTRDFDAVELGYTLADVTAEADRCLRCHRPIVVVA